MIYANILTPANNKFYIEITSTAFPQIGFGLGGLKWVEVEELIIEILKDTDLTIELYTYRDEKGWYIEKLTEIFNASSISDLSKHCDISEKHLDLIKSNINRVNSLADLNLIKGIGKTTVEKVYRLLDYKTPVKINPLKNLTIF